MGRKSIEIAGPDFHEEKTIGFEKIEDGKFRKVVNRIQRDRKSGEIKKFKDPQAEEIYELTDSEDYDESILFFDFDGIEKLLKFKLIHQ